MPYELFLALRYLLAKRKQTFLSIISLISVLGVTVGVAALILALALMTGFQEDIRSKVLGSNAHLTVFGGWGGRNITDPAGTMAAIAAEEAVAATGPLVVEKGLVTSDANRRGYAALIQGIDPAVQGEVTSLADDLARGASGGPVPGLADLRLPVPAEQPGGPRAATVFVGKDLAVNLGVRVGDRITLTVPQARLSPFAVRPKQVRYEVAGVTESGFYDYDTSRVYIHLAEAQRLFGMGEEVTAIQVRLHDVGRLAEGRLALQLLLGESYWVRDLMEQNQAFFSALRTEKLISFLVITLIVLVAALNIVSTLILMVMEKVRDIGTLVSMGATPRGVMSLFLLQGGVIGVAGTVLGCALGVGIAWMMDTYQIWQLDPDVYFIPYLPFKVRVLDFSLTAAVALLISFLATLYPAWRASRLDPIEALRYE